MNLQLRSVTKVLNGTAVLNDISYEFSPGKIYGIKGKNGSGKTMLLRAICGLIVPTEGTIEFDGKLLRKGGAFPGNIGVLIENPAFLPLYTGYTNLMLLASLNGRIGETEVRTALERVGLAPDGKKPYCRYSLGMKQRLGIACAIMEHPDVILLDEPINAIDENGVAQIRDLLLEEKARGAIIILACHDAEELNYLADEIIYMEEGKICDANVVSGKSFLQ